jgi:hypothetical protein
MPTEGRFPLYRRRERKHPSAGQAPEAGDGQGGKAPRRTEWVTPGRELAACFIVRRGKATKFNAFTLSAIDLIPGTPLKTGEQLGTILLEIEDACRKHRPSSPRLATGHAHVVDDIYAELRQLLVRSSGIIEEDLGNTALVLS